MRRLYVLVSRLIDMRGQCALAPAIDERLTWPDETHILANIADSLEASNWMFIKANSEDSDAPIPEPLPRPGMGSAEESQPELASSAEVAKFFNDINAML
ncbi:DUF5361 domain-containing protein [Streptomyces yunnanensis]|uniref:DUF5361 domain-containing protein n=1 Tax=Streptomyces yunnanensis TaxID=156453 RepID=A0ABY8A378_9ACTN|nr:hypothetical protein [Streptomyces yunnanensis]WEB38766.1 DUF5361 domain-containing protein [Streptomyces yunnanensis]